MGANPYEVLGVAEDADIRTIRATYRKLVLKYHPDTTSEPQAAERFIEITRAYEILSDAGRRAEYDRLRQINAQLRAQRNQPRPEPQPPRPTRVKAPPPVDPIQEDLKRLIQLLGRMSFGEAETLAKDILQRDPHQAVAYAVLGDIARSRGELNRAAKMYAFAAQFDPRNSLYLRKHEELLDHVNRMRYERERPQGEEGRWIAPFLGIVLTLGFAGYVAVAREPPLFGRDSLISTWTLGLIVMLFLSGVVMGATLALSDIIDRFSAATTNATGRLSPSVALLTVALVNFWAAAGLYVLIGMLQRNFILSISRMMVAVIGICVIMTVGAGAGNQIDPWQVLTWGGNVAYLGALCGWLVADSFRA